MTPRERRRITQQRLDEWETSLSLGFATPIVCIGIAHGAKSGDIHVCLPEDVPIELVRGSLEYLLKHLPDDASKGAGGKTITPAPEG